MQQQYRRSPRRNFSNNRNNNNSNKRFAAVAMPINELEKAINSFQKNKIINEMEPEKSYISTNSFDSLPISGFLKKNILRKGYTTPTPIQDQAILHIIEGKDVIGIANTGTGKTAAFLIPLINKVMNNKSEKVLIITPTRELAVQIDEEFRDFSRGMGIYAGLCIGGANFFKQRAELRRKPHFVIGTPGRIREFIQEDVLDLSQFHSVVLDEADRMVDIGFINDIKYFISLFPVERQSLFFSATIEKKEKEILQAFVKEPVTVSVKKQDTAININQEIIKVENKNKKIEQLHDLLIKQNFNKVLIFGRTKWGIQKLTEELIYRGFKAGAIHGNKSQSQRQRILDQFKKDEIQILLATDVASRGLDINNVSHVINYDMPASYEDYIHRIGRTGRAEKKGTALTFVE